MRVSYAVLLILSACSPFSGQGADADDAGSDASANASTDATATPDANPYPYPEPGPSDASAGDASHVTGHFCSLQTGTPIFCDDFEPADGGPQTFSNDQCQNFVGSIGPDSDPISGNFFEVRGTIPQSSISCDAWFDIPMPGSNGSLTMDFDLRALAFTDSYAGLGGLVVNTTALFGIAIYQGGFIAEEPIDTVMPTTGLKNDLNWHHVHINLTFDGPAFQQTTLLDGKSLEADGIPRATTIPNGLSAVRLDIGSFFTGSAGGNIDVQIDNVIVRAP